MKIGSLKISPGSRVVAFVLGVVAASGTVRHLTTGVTRYGGVTNTRADDPVAYWSVVATMAYLTVLLFCVALVRRKTDA
jgi:hypothetical protein